jgi:hypothetical protein
MSTKSNNTSKKMASNESGQEEEDFAVLIYRESKLRKAEAAVAAEATSLCLFETKTRVAIIGKDVQDEMQMQMPC